MSGEVKNKALVHRLYELMTRGDLDAKRSCSPNFVVTGYSRRQRQDSLREELRRTSPKGDSEISTIRTRRRWQGT